MEASPKIFIGQVPLSFGEDDLKPLVEQFGKVIELKIIRDSATGNSRGCAFLTLSNRAESDACINSLNNSITLKGMSNPIQVKYAHSGQPLQAPQKPTVVSRQEFKLFVGQLHISAGEDEVRAFMMRFGAVEDVKVLRRPDGVSKCCAFVTFRSEASALAAIQALDGNHVMEGCRAPLQVRFSDSDAQKLQRRTLTASSTFPSAIVPANAGMINSFGVGYGGAFQIPADMMYGPASQPHQVASVLSAPSQGMHSSHFAILHQPQRHSTVIPQRHALPAVFPNFFSQEPVADVPVKNLQTRQAQGPDNANVFVYNIPLEYTDAELYQCFIPFGLIVSTKVFIDPVTHRSKGFGFVSYASADAAAVAIQSMNGYSIAGRILKVSLKRSHTNKPY